MRSKLAKLVCQNEALIKDLATFAATKGNRVTIQKQEDLLKVQKKVNYFKMLLATGEFTYSELETDVLTRYGVTKDLVPEKNTEAKKKQLDWTKVLKEYIEPVKQPQPMSREANKAIEEFNRKDDTFIARLRNLFKI